MSKVLDYAAKLAISAKHTGLVLPIPRDKWLRPTTDVMVAGFKLLSIGVLTSSESVVLQELRAKINFAVNAQRLEMLQVLAAIQIRLDVDGERTLMALMMDPDALMKHCEAKEVSEDEALEWVNAFQVAIASVDVQDVKNKIRQIMVTFIMTMRYDPLWDYEETEQLSDAELDEILAFIYSEEGNQVVNIQDVDEDRPIKKP
jgi:hypothetical protein